LCTVYTTEEVNFVLIFSTINNYSSIVISTNSIYKYVLIILEVYGIYVSVLAYSSPANSYLRLQYMRFPTFPHVRLRSQYSHFPSVQNVLFCTYIFQIRKGSLRARALNVVSMISRRRYESKRLLLITNMKSRTRFRLLAYHRLNGSSSPVLTATCLSYGSLCDFLTYFSRTDLEVTPLDRF